MTKIKICGLRRRADIDYVNELKPDYVGFVFAKSKRRVDIVEAQELIAVLNKNIKTVGVFVNEEADKVMETAHLLKLDVLQFHGTENKGYIDSFREFEVWKAIGIGEAADLEKIGMHPADGYLLDSVDKGQTGGNGVCFDWNILKSLKTEKPFFLAGGLTPQNIIEAIKNVRPYGVDVSSGVESSGVKDFNKMKEFITRIRQLG